MFDIQLKKATAQYDFWVDHSRMAQWLAHLPSKQGVAGSNPATGSFVVSNKRY